MTTVQIDLAKNPDVAALVADKEPGDKVFACFSIKSQDTQTLDLRIEEFADSPDDLDKTEDAEEGETEDNEEDDAKEADKSPEGKEAEAEPYTGAKSGGYGRALAAKMMSGDSSF